MSRDEFDRAILIMSRQRPFRPWLLEFASGVVGAGGPPRGGRPLGNLYLYVIPGRRRLFAASSVSSVILEDEAPRQ